MLATNTQETNTGEFIPSRDRNAQTLNISREAGRQPLGKAFPQLIRDDEELSMHDHVRRAASYDHPSQKPPSVKGIDHVKGTKGPVPPPPPLPTHLKTSSEAPPRISATDLQSVSLRSTRRRPETTPRKPDEMGYMEPPSLSDILAARKTLKHISP